MVRLTLIARVKDGLPLAEGLDTDKELEMYSYKSQAKVGSHPYPSSFTPLFQPPILDRQPLPHLHSLSYSPFFNRPFSRK